MTEVLQIIDGDGQFHRTACDGLVNASGPGDQRNNYQVVAIMGPQSSGKSTLMNHLVSRKRQIQQNCCEDQTVYPCMSSLPLQRFTTDSNRPVVRHHIRDDES